LEELGEGLGRMLDLRTGDGRLMALVLFLTKRWGERT